MVWGCMTADGPGFMTKIDGGLDAELYCNILEDELQQSAADTYDFKEGVQAFLEKRKPIFKGN